MEGILQVPKQLKMGTSEGVFVIRLQLKWHNFGQRESFRGISRHPKDVPFVSFGGGRTVWNFGHYKLTKRTNFGDRHTKAPRVHGTCCHLVSDVEL